jgi:septal ring factor EnvC (AmiA/AmiB activator)
MGIFLLSQPGAKEAIKPAVDTLSQTFLGAISIICIAVAVASVVLALRVANARTADQKQLREDYRKDLEKNEKVIDKMLTTFSGMKAALDQLKEAERGGQQAMAALKTSNDDIKNTLQLLIIQGVRRHSPPSGVPKQGR